jgi:hypothetical protein
VLLAGFTLLFPTVRAYLGQQAELRALATQVTTAEQDEESLEQELDRWQDPAYVAAQARARLGYVMPGETSYRVIDPEVVAEDPAADGGAEPTAGPAVPAGGALAPWYQTIWESVQAAGGADAAAEVAEDADVEDGGE